MDTVSILGIGRAGGALTIALDRAGIKIDQLIFKSSPVQLPGIEVDQIGSDQLKAVTSQILIIATPDPEIPIIGEQIAKFNVLPRVALHLSGSLTSGQLEPLRSKGVAIGSMHPLVSISDPLLGADRLAGSYFCIEGDSAAIEAATGLVTQIGGHPFSIDTSLKPLYHASAVMASGSVTALFDVAIEMLSACGLERSNAHEILLPLLESSVANLSKQTTEKALTGPFVRGDLEAFERHLEAFNGTTRDDVKRMYLLLAERSVEMITRSGRGASQGLAEAISVAKRKTGC